MQLSTAACKLPEILNPAEVADLLSPLLAAPGRAQLMAEHSGLHRPEVVVELLRQIELRRTGVPREVLELALAAGRLAGKLRPIYAQLAADLCAQALLEQANAWRMLGVLRRAALTVQLARTEAEAGTGCPVLAGQVLWLGGVIAGERGRWAEANRALAGAVACLEECGERWMAARARLSRARALGASGRVVAAQHATLAALAALEGGEPSAILWATHNLANLSVAAGEVELARYLVARLWNKYEVCGGAIGPACRGWITGQILQAEGRLVEAAEHLSGAALQLLESGREHDAALVELELALLEVQRGHLGAALEHARSVANLVADFRPAAAAAQLLVHQFDTAVAASDVCWAAVRRASRRLRGALGAVVA